eukprot:scaffold130068_cov43-Tisochrysis_lutea.AAC.2
MTLDYGACHDRSRASPRRASPLANAPQLGRPTAPEVARGRALSQPIQPAPARPSALGGKHQYHTGCRLPPLLYALCNTQGVTYP